MRISALFMVVLALGACKKDKSADSAPVTGGPNAGIGVGLPTGVGTGTGSGLTTTLDTWPCLPAQLPPGGVDDPTNRKTVPFTARGGATPDLALGELTLTRKRGNSTMIRFILPVTNTSTSTLCYVKINNVDFIGPNAVVVTSEPADTANGIMGITGIGTETKACLPPGFTGYFHGISHFDLDEVESVEFDLDPGYPGTGAHPTRIRAASVAGAPPDSFAVEAEHLSGPPANVASRAPFILLDNAGNPIYWSFLHASAGTTLDQGQTLSFEDDMSSWQIAGTQVCTIFEYYAP